MGLPPPHPVAAAAAAASSNIILLTLTVHDADGLVPGSQTDSILLTLTVHDADGLVPGSQTLCGGQHPFTAPTRPLWVRALLGPGDPPSWN